ncbi:MaoC family dehydratase [Rhodoplanes sp. SY1]|uniref:MaoC family dehydratase n=1 Tax=Rhodoplanes sp. SY1 TaxID=3166646 RepID=UPI0038B5BB09
MSQSDFAVPVADRHFEDYAPGRTEEHGSVTVTEDEIVAFARRFDPQTMHTDPAAAARGAFGGLIASGWHTAALTMRMIADGWLTATASLASPGVDELRWIKPVRPGDTLRIRVTTVSAERSRSKPDRGLVRSFVEVLNQRDEVVMSMIGMVLIRCRTLPP